MQQVSEDSFLQDVIKSSYEQPVLVQFWAPWCGPCHGLTATIDQIAEQHNFPVKYTGLDVDQFTDVALQYKVMGVPNTKIFVSGYVLDEFSDPMPANEIVLFIKNALVLPDILRYSHFSGKINNSFLKDIENEVSSSTRKEAYHLTLAKYYFHKDQIKSQHFLEKIPDESDQFEDRLYINDLYSLMDIEFTHDPIIRKLWSAKNALKKQNFESTYQFLLQANKIDVSAELSDLARVTLLAFRRFLGSHHELNRKYESQFSNVI